MTGRCVIAIDAGTTGVRSRAVFARETASGTPASDSTIASYREFAQHFPEPGWVEHDATEIWLAVKATLIDVVQQVGADNVAAIGITNQRETVLAWNRRTGKPYGTAIVWQDRRTAARCDQLAADGWLPTVRETTGLVLDPYFSASKIEWLLANRSIPNDGDLAIGTIDSWLLWNLTGGAVHATDASNASRTMLFDIRTMQWSAAMCSLFGVPSSALAMVMPSSGRFGVTSDKCGAPAGISISGIAGDQQAALFGQACFAPGMAKNTYGTGSFILLNVGEQCPPVAEGMLTTVAWSLRDASLGGAATTYALEGAVFVTGAAVQWLRDGLGIIGNAADVGPLAASVPDNGGVYLVPAFTGLGSPWWDPYARGTIVGITRGSTRAHLARAVVEAMAYQTRDAMEAMSTVGGVQMSDLRVDGGASVMDDMLQFQADQLGVTVRRPTDQETTALGAAYLAGLAEGVWPSLAAIAAEWSVDAVFEPAADRTLADLGHATWRRAVERAGLGASLTGNEQVRNERMEKAMTSTIVPGGHGRAVRVRAGESVRVVNTHGTQVVDFWAIHVDRPEIAMSMQHSRIPWRNLRPHPGDGMLDEERSTMMILTDDTSPGVHDTVIAACDPFRYAQLGGAPDHRSCCGNFKEALAAIGISRKAAVPAPLNLFMNIPWDAEGNIEFLPTVSAAGDSVTFQAEVDVIVIASACPMDIVPINGPGGGTPVDVELIVG